MPQREEILYEILCKKFGCGIFLKPAYQDFSNSKFHSGIFEVYKKLYGQLQNYPVGFRGYDIQLKNCIVELDEEQHFNRYRALTLDSSIYNQTKCFAVSEYKRFCRDFESDCLSKADNRKYWSTSSTEKQFGKSSPEGILTGLGSSRWKQRAFYDFLRDVGQKISNYKLIRISVHQKLKDKTVDEILSRQLSQYYDELFKIVEKAIQ